MMQISPNVSNMGNMMNKLPIQHGGVGGNISFANKNRFTMLPLVQQVKRSVFGMQPKQLESVATRIQEVYPAETITKPKAYFLENQLERVTAVGFADADWRREMHGGFEFQHSPTKAITLTDAWLIDGVLYKGDAKSHLYPRSQKFLPLLTADTEVDQGAIYCTAAGNQYFGVWLQDDCLTYLMAESFGMPVTTHQKPYLQAEQYEQLIGMHPARLKAAYFKQVTIFEDVGQNQHKSRRAAEFRRRLLDGVDYERHPGVFIVRGSAGQARVMENEMALAEHFQRTRGFKIIDPFNESIANTIATCAGAETIISIEGSQIAHGLNVLPEGGSLLVLQPPNRFGTLLKHVTDRENQHFGFVVGHPTEKGFRVDADEIERTLDLMPKLY